MPSSSAHRTRVRKPMVIIDRAPCDLPPFKPFESIESDNESDGYSSGFAGAPEDLLVGHAAGQPRPGNRRLSVRPGPAIRRPDGRAGFSSRFPKSAGGEEEHRQGSGPSPSTSRYRADRSHDNKQAGMHQPKEYAPLSDDEVIFVGSHPRPPRSRGSRADKSSRSKIRPDHSPSRSRRKPTNGLVSPMKDTKPSGSATRPIELFSSPPTSPSARSSSYDFLASEKTSPELEHSQPDDKSPRGREAGLDIGKRMALASTDKNGPLWLCKKPGAGPVASSSGTRVSLPQAGPTWRFMHSPTRSPTRLAGSASPDTDVPVGRPREACLGPDKSHVWRAMSPGAGPNTPRPQLPMTPSLTPNQEASPVDAPKTGLNMRPVKCLDAPKDGLDGPPVKRRIAANPPATHPDEWGEYEASTCHQCRTKKTLPKMICDQSQDPNCLVRVCHFCLMVKPVFDGIPELRPPLFKFVPGGRMLCIKCRDICPCASCRRARGEPEVCRRGFGYVPKGHGGLRPEKKELVTAQQQQKLRFSEQQKEKEVREAEAIRAREERRAAAVQQRQGPDAAAVRPRQEQESAMRQKQQALVRQKEDAIARRKKEERLAGLRLRETELAATRRAEEERAEAAARQKGKQEAAAWQQRREQEALARRVQGGCDALAVQQRNEQQAEAAQPREERRVGHGKELEAAKCQIQNKQPSTTAVPAVSRADMIFSTQLAKFGSQKPHRKAAMPILLSPSSKSRETKRKRLTSPELRKKQKRPEASEAWRLDVEAGGKDTVIGFSYKGSDGNIAGGLKRLPAALSSPSNRQGLLSKCVSHNRSQGAHQNQHAAINGKKSSEAVELKKPFAPLATSSRHTIDDDEKFGEQTDSPVHKSRSQRKKERKARKSLEKEMARLELQKEMKKLKKKQARKQKRKKAEKIAEAVQKAQMIQDFLRAGLPLQEAISTSEKLLKDL